MHNLNQKIQQYIGEHKIKRRSKVIAAAMSAAVAVSVCTSLIMPAISAAKDESAVVTVQEYSADSTVYENDFTDFITSATVSATGSVTEADDGTTRLPADLEIRYELAANTVPSSGGANITNSITYTLPPNVKIPDESQRSGKVDIEGYSEQGDYTIDEDGFVVITFPDNFLDTDGYRSKPIIGWLKLNCEIVRNEGDDSNSVDVDFSDTVKADVVFPDRGVAVYKSGTNNGDGTITWTIKIDNPDGNSLEGYTMTDDMFGADADFGDISSFATYENNTLTFKDVNDSQLTINYTTPVAEKAVLSSDNTTNTVNLKNPDGDEASKSTVNVWQGSPLVTMEKTGAATSYTDTGAEIEWIITVNNLKNYDIGGFTVSDTAFSDATDLKVNGASYTLDGDTITFDENSTNAQVVISYTTTATSAADYENTAKINYPDSTKNPVTSTAEVQQAMNFSKTGKANSGKGTITWTVTLTNNIPADGFSFDGYTLDDAALADASSISVSPSGEIDSSGKLSGTNGATEVVVTYETPVSMDGDESSTKVTNKVGIIGTDDEPLDTVEKTVQYVKRDKSSKTSTREKDSMGNYKTPEISDEGTVSLPWEVQYLKENGDFNGQTIYDTVSADPSLTCTYDLSTLKILFEENGTNTWNTLDSKYYTATVDGDSLTVEFKTDDFFDTVSGIKLDYNTVTDVSTFVGAATDVKVTVTNEVDFNGDTPQKDTSFTIINEPGYKKYDYSTGTLSDETSGDEEKSVDSLTKITYNGEEYYLFNWCIKVNESGRYTEAEDISLTDTLPEGMQLYISADNTIPGTYGDQQKPAAEIHYNSSYVVAQSLVENGGTSNFYKYTVNGQDVTFTVVGKNGITNTNQNTHSGKVFYIYYDTIIKVSDLQEKLADGNYTITNTVKKDGENEVSQSQTITPSLNEEKVSKKGTTTTSNGFINYSIDINPDAEDLAENGDTFTVEDFLTVDDYVDPGSVGVNLNKIKFYEVSDDGKKTDITSDCTYVFDNKPELTELNKKELTFETTTANNANYMVNGLTEGGTAEIKLKASEGTADGTVIYPWYTGDNTFASAYPTCENGYYSFTIDDVKDETLYFGNINDTQFVASESSAVSYISGHEYAGKLKLTVPDNKHIVVEYQYFVYKVGVTEGTRVTLSNSASAKSEVPLGTSTASNEIALASATSAGATSENYIKLMKVDATDYSVQLDASFSLFRYNADTGTWQVATAMGDYTYGDTNPTVSTEAKKPSSWADVTIDATKSDYEVWQAAAAANGYKINTNGDVYNFNLDAKYIYMIVETKAPDGYQVAQKPMYFMYSGAPDNFSSLVKTIGIDSDDVEFISAGTGENGKFLVADVKEVKVNTSKTWTGGAPENSTATFKLMRSTTNVSEGLPSDLKEVDAADLGNQKAEVTLSKSDSWSYSWTNLPSSDTHGNEWYYYVKEISYTIDGTEYTVGKDDEASEYEPVYTASISKGTEEFAVVVKDWSEDADENSTVTYKLMRSKTDVSNGLPSGLEDVSAVDLGEQQAEVTITNDGYGSYLWSNLPTYDSNGNRWYYYVQEISYTIGDTTYMVPEEDSVIEYTTAYTLNKEAVNNLSVANTSDNVEEEVTLPETGGNGTLKYLVGGGAIMLLGGAYYLISKRRAEIAAEDRK